jgi:tetratricopeptide (TPR) repeat protein
VLLIAFVLAAYGATLRADFVNWDDPVHVYENQRVTAPDALRRSWSNGTNPGFYPILFGTYGLEWRAAGGKPWLLHLDNVLLHAVNTLLVGALARELGMSPMASWLVAGLWALHPAQVESVAWITERKNVLYTAFWLGSLLLYSRWRRAGVSNYAGSVLLFALSLLSKGAALTLPAALVLVEWARGRRLDRRFWLSLVPYVALGILGGVGLLGLVPATLEVPPLESRFAVACRALWFYLATFLWPHPLVPVYPTWSLEVTSPSNLVAALGVLTLVAVGIVTWRRVPRIILFGVGLFVTNIFLVLGVVWNSYHGFAFVADRYLYLPAVGLAIVPVAGLGELARTARLPARAVTIAIVVWCTALAFVTWRQVPVWHDSDRLWAYTLAHNPDCSPCLQNLGLLFAERGDLTGAADHYERAFRLGMQPEGNISFGNVRLAQDRLDDAVALYELAAKSDPGNAKASYNLGIVLERQGKTAEAIARYEEAVRRQPDWPDPHNNLGVALFGSGRPDEARAHFEAVLRLHPGDVEAELNLGMIAKESQQWEAAERHYRAAASVAKEEHLAAAAHASLGDVLLERDKVAEAGRQYEAALRSAPDDADVLVALAWLRATGAEAGWRDGAAAVRLAERACSLTANEDANALDALAAAYAEAGRFPDAVRTGRQALEVAEEGSALAQEIAARVALYESKRPYRVPSRAASASP